MIWLPGGEVSGPQSAPLQNEDDNPCLEGEGGLNEAMFLVK